MNSNAAATHPADLKSRTLNLRNILVPIDFSPQSENALLHASFLAGELGANLTLLFVAEPIPYPFESPASEGETVRKVKERLEKLCASASTDAPAKNATIVRHGRPFEEICCAAEELQSDLIVIAPHGSRPLEHMLLGSTAERVVRHAGCPVLVVRPQQKAPGLGHPPTSTQFKKLLVPMDFSDCSWKALDYAVPLALRFHAGLVLFHTVQLYPVFCEGALVDVCAVECQMRECVEHMMRELHEGLDPEIRTETIIGKGQPQAEIIRCAQQHEIDLIVLTTHGHTGLAHMFLGSTAEKVVRHAPCPVLVVRACEHEFVTTCHPEHV